MSDRKDLALVLALVAMTSALCIVLVGGCSTKGAYDKPKPVVTSEYERGYADGQASGYGMGALLGWSYGRR